MVKNILTNTKNKMNKIRLAKIKKEIALIELDLLLFSKNYTKHTCNGKNIATKYTS
ncbi:hypothetical protein [Ferruginibacter sp. SUN106]|uniref:hypothetical protein n=1 Tax=Ferruginibacter sp. SUN106 TaxID=2978348 RepID=UPI003D35FEC9